MGLFSNALPKRKWPKFTASLGAKLLSEGNDWFSSFQRETAHRKFELKGASLSPDGRKLVTMIQLSAVSATLQENGYASLSDSTFLTELIYIVLTQEPPANLHRDIKATLHIFNCELNTSLRKWAEHMAVQISNAPGDPKLIEELTRSALGIAVLSKIGTCLACDDANGAKKIANLFIR